MIYGCNCKNPNSAFQKITQFNRGKEKNVGVNIYTKFFMYTIEKKNFSELYIHMFWSSYTSTT